MNFDLAKFRIATRLIRLLGHQRSRSLVSSVARRLGPRLVGQKADTLRSNLERVDHIDLVEPIAADDEPGFARKPGPVTDETLAYNLSNYAKYYVDLMALPHMSDQQIADGFSVNGYQHIQNSLDAEHGPILVLPHLGTWEWGAAWLTRVAGEKVAAVVEVLDPPEVFEWFRSARTSYGLDVIPLGARAFPRLVEAVNSNSIVCLLADRDMTERGITVDMFGHKTSLPAGPAILARRTGAPILTVAVYMTKHGAHCNINAPISVSDQDSNEQVMQQVADQLAGLISAAPEQWYVLSELPSGKD